MKASIIMAVIYTTDEIHILAKEIAMPSENHIRPMRKGAEFAGHLKDLFRRLGWHVLQQPREGPANLIADIVVDSGQKKYIIEVKNSSEGRRDRLIPLLSQVILQSQLAARRYSEPVVPVAVVAAPSISEPIAEQLIEFAMEHSPENGVGIIDAEGFRLFRGYGLEALNKERPNSISRLQWVNRRVPSNLFSDLNQWMLKILMAKGIPESLLSAPRHKYQNGSQLAQAAGASAMSASRLLQHLALEGFLDKKSHWLRLVRIENLMQRWVNVNQGRYREIPVWWIIRGKPDQLYAAVRAYKPHLHLINQGSESSYMVEQHNGSARICLGLFEAANVLGVGFVRGVAPHIYVEYPEPEAIRQLGLSLEGSGRQPDAWIRIPENKEAVFRGVVKHDGIPASDIIQVWLDVANHPARGREQAEQIWKRVLAPAIHEESN